MPQGMFPRSQSLEDLAHPLMGRSPHGLLLVARGALVGGDFVFVDFNETQGLRLNGDAETSACAAEAGRAHGPDERGAARRGLAPPRRGRSQ